MSADNRKSIGSAKVVAFGTRRHSTKSKLWTVLFWICTLFVLYKGYLWVEAYKASAAALKSINANVGNAPKATPRSEPPKAANVPPISASQARATHSPSDAANTRSVTKCVLNGAVSYSDGDCPIGAKNSLVTLDVSKVGTVAPQARPVDRQGVTYASPTVVSRQQNSPPLKQVPAVNPECVLLKAQIEQIDSATRQPLSIQQQEWYKEARRKVRQRETDLKC